MSHKEEEYQRIHKEYQNAPGALNAQEQAQELIERNKRLPGVDDPMYLMDAEQLRDYYEKRNQDTEDNSFRIRTKYYFEDIYMADAKVQRYRNYADHDEMVNAYARQHGGRHAYKRRGDAKTAADKFQKMQRLMVRQKADNAGNLTPLQIYKRREEVMTLRMEGMIAAAQLKSKPGNMHHLVTRAQYSCYMVLKDQLAHLIQEPQRQQDRRKLERKLHTIDAKLNALFTELKNRTPSAQKQWQEDQFEPMDYSVAQSNYNDQREEAVSDEDAKTLFHLQQFHTKMQGVQWPARCVYKHARGGAPINPAERKMEEWNTRAGEIRAHGSDMDKERLEEEGIRMFMSISLPDPETLARMGTDYLKDHMRTYYEMTEKALGYYKPEIGKEKGFLAEYAEENSDFREKLDYVEAVKDYMEYRMATDKGFVRDAQQGYKIDAKRRNDAEGRIKLESLRTAYRTFKMYEKAPEVYDKHSIMPNIPVHAVPHADGDEAGEQNLIQQQHEEQQNQVQHEEQNQPQNQEQQNHAQHEGQNQNVIIEEEDDGPLVEDDVQKDKKGDFANAYDLFQKDLEEQRKQAQLEKEAEDREKERKNEELRRQSEQIEKGEKLAAERKQKNAAEKKEKQPENEVNENEINVINENRIIVDDEAPVRMIQNAGELLDHAEYQALLAESEAVFARYRVVEEEEESTPKEKNAKEKTVKKKKVQEKNGKEAISSMMRLVHFDEEGKPVTEEDKKNHAWNLKWLNAWKEDNFDVREEMIREELNEITDRMLPLPKDNMIGAVRDFLTENDYDRINGRYQELETLKKTRKLSAKETKELTELAGTKKSVEETLAKYRRKLDKWVRTQFDEDGNDTFMAALHKMRALSDLETAHPALKVYFEKNKAFDGYRQTMESLSAYLKFSGSKKKGKESGKDADKLNSLAWNVLKKNWQSVEHAKDPYAPYVSRPFVAMETEKEREEEFHRHALESLGLTEEHFAPKLNKTQKKELEFAKARYDLMKYYKECEKFETCQEYQDLFAKTGSTSTMGRSLTIMMKPVLFDKNNRPLPAYRSNHEWNLKWLKTWVDKDEKERDRMIGEYYPHVLDELDETDLPKVKLSKEERAIIKRYAEVQKEADAKKKEIDELKARIRKDDKNASYRDNPEYQKLMKELSAIGEKKLPLSNEADKVARRYANSKEFQSWVTGKVKERSSHESHSYIRSRTTGSMDGLGQACPFVKDYDRRNPRFARKSQMLDKARFAYNDYVKTNYGIDISFIVDYKSDWLDDDEARNGSVSNEISLVQYLTLWNEEYEATQQEKEDDAAQLARIQKETNPNFKAKDLAYYKKLKSIKELTINPTYAGIDISKTKKKYGLTKNDSLDRFALIGFKPVQFDKLNQPVSKEDEKNHEWNLKWMKAWEDDDVNTREAMIGEMLPHLYDQIKIPEFNLSKQDQKLLSQAIEKEELYKQAENLFQECKDEKQKKQLEKMKNDAKDEMNKANKKLEDLAEKYQGIFAKWAEGIAQNQDMGFVQAYLTSLSTDKLMTVHPSVKQFFEDNPAIQELSHIVDIVGRLFSSSVLSIKHRMKMTAFVDPVGEEYSRTDKENYMDTVNFETPTLLKFLVKYDKAKQKKKVPFVSLSGNENYLENEKEKDEYLKLWKKQPLITQRGYSVYKTKLKAMVIDHNDEYNKLYEKARGVFKQVSGGGVTLSRDASSVMRHVEVDENGKPLTKQDEENHAWNLKWLKALDDDDFELREEMIAEELPKHFQIRELPKPSEQLVKLHRRMNEMKKQKGWKDSWDGKRLEQEHQRELQKFREELVRFTEKKLDAKDVAFFEEMRRGLSLDILRRMHPSVQQYLDNNPELVKRNNMVDAYSNFQSAYLTKTYLVETGTAVKAVELSGDALRKSNQKMQYMEDVTLTTYLDKYLEYQEVENEPYVPFKSVIREEDKKRKEKRREAKEEEKRKAQELEERRKKNEPFVREIQKVNPNFNPDFYEPIARTDVRGKTFQNKEYLALAKNITLEGFGKELNGPMSFCLETVEMDEKGNVLPEYKGAHERNLEWLNLLVKAGKEDHQKEIRDRVLEAARDLVKTFPLPELSDLTGMGPCMKFIYDPVGMKTKIQKLQAYQKILKNCPQMAVTNQKVVQHINLLMEAMSILLEQNRIYPGIDYSGDQFKAIKPLRFGDEEKMQLSKKTDNYLKAREAFLNPKKQKKK